MAGSGRRPAGRTDLYVSGLIVPEFLQVTDTDSGEVLWQDQGWLTQNAALVPGQSASGPGVFHPHPERAEVRGHGDLE